MKAILLTTVLYAKKAFILVTSKSNTITQKTPIVKKSKPILYHIIAVLLKVTDMIFIKNIKNIKKK